MFLMNDILIKTAKATGMILWLGVAYYYGIIDVIVDLVHAVINYLNF